MDIDKTVSSVVYAIMWLKGNVMKNNLSFKIRVIKFVYKLGTGNLF